MLSANQSFQPDNNILSSQRIVGHNQNDADLQLEQQKSFPHSDALPYNDKVSANQIDNQNLNDVGSIVFDDKKKLPLYKKKIFIISCVVAFALALIIGGLLSYFIISGTQDSNSPTIPKTYTQFESKIMAGQENNLIKIINVPKSQRVYQYTLLNNQKTSQNENLENESLSQISHKLGLVCVNVTDESFDMLLYVMESTFLESNTKDNSTLSGYPSIKNIKPQKRFLKSESDNFNDSSSQMYREIRNEFSALTENEVKMLSTKNITADEYYQSNLPIIRFTMTKNGAITEVQQPINLRYDIHSVFLNILEQFTPIVMKDFYTVVQQESSTNNNGKRRVLSSATSQYTHRMLNNQDIIPNMEAELNSDMRGNLQKSYSQVDNKQNETLQRISYSQKSIMANGALKTSEVKSTFQMQNNKVEQQNQVPLMKSIGMESNCTISFLYQEDEMNSKSYEELIQDQEEMALLKLSWFESIDIYNKIFNQSFQSNKSDNQDENKDRILKDSGKVMGKAINKSIFRQNYASIQFGADIRSECYESTRVSDEDSCSVGLYSFFNGVTLKVAEKQVKVNISKILKYYQYIQHIISDKLVFVNEKLLTKINSIKSSLDAILTQVEQMIDVQSNPLLKDIYNVVYNDELKIISQINQIELFINTAIKNVNLIAEDPLTTLKTRTLNFLLKKQIDIREQVENIETFYKGQFKRILNYIISVKNNGISDKVYSQLKSALEHYDSVIIELIEIPVKKMLDSLEASILEQANKAYNNAIEADSHVSRDYTKKAKNAAQIAAPLKIKQILTVSGLSENLSVLISSSMRQIFNQSAVHDALQTGLRQSLDLAKQNILKQLDSVKRNNSAEGDKEVDDIIDDIEGVIDYSINLYNDLTEVKEDIVEIVNALKKLQRQDMKKFILDMTSHLINFPANLAVQIKDSAVVTVQKIKRIGVDMRTNLVQWKDDLTNNSKALLEDVKNLYRDIVDFLKVKQLPSDDPKFYEQPLFDDISQITQGVNDLVNTQFADFTDTFNRFTLITTKFKTFIIDFKALGKRTVSYFEEIKFAITSINIDGGIIQQYVQKSISGERKNADLLISNTINSNIVEQVEQQDFAPFQQSFNSLIQTDFNTFKQLVHTQQTNISQIYKDTIQGIIASADFEKTFTYNPKDFNLEYDYYYPTPIGVALKLKLYAKWETGFNLNFAFKNANLDLSAGASTKVTVSSEVTASIYIAEVGGYGEGTFLETSLITGLQLQVLNNYKGKFYIDINFKPYVVRIGIFYLHYSPTEIFSCANASQLTKEQIQNQIQVKKNVQVVNKSFSSSIYSKIKSAIKCLAHIEIKPKRHDIFTPLEVTGTTYSKRLYEESF